jgi:hypothetical protein
MGVVKLPRLEMYWSGKYAQPAIIELVHSYSAFVRMAQDLHCVNTLLFTPAQQANYSHPFFACVLI